MFFIHTACGRTLFRENSGVINSPNYPGQYPYNVRCFYTIHRYSSAPTLLRSQVFSLEYHSSCSYDYVKVSLQRHKTLFQSPENLILSVTYTAPEQFTV